MKHWRELSVDERAWLIMEHIFHNEPCLYYSEATKFVLLETVIFRMEEMDCPFIELVWMHPRNNPGSKKFGAKFWCKNLKTETWGFADNIADAMLEAAVLAALGRLNLG